MATFLEVLITFVATMLVLALAAQSLQELLKSAFAWKARTRNTAIRRLIVEAARATGIERTDGEAIYAEVSDRLRGLSQNGVFRGIRPDVVSKDALVDLVKSINPARVGALKPLSPDVARERLEKQVAHNVGKWFDLAIQPVNDRYRRRMRLVSLGVGLAVVLAVNANVFDLTERARRDPAYRAAVQRVATVLWAADSAVRVIDDSLGIVQADSTRRAEIAPLEARRAREAGVRDSLALAAVTAPDAAFLGYPAGFQVTWRWARGILVSALLVSLGAPFWHDILESIFGLKKKVVGQSAAGRT